MYVKVMPSDLKTVKVIKRKIRGHYTVSLTLPIDVVKRHGLDNREDEEIIIAYVCKADEDCEVQNS